MAAWGFEPARSRERKTMNPTLYPLDYRQRRTDVEFEPLSVVYDILTTKVLSSFSIKRANVWNSW